MTVGYRQPASPTQLAFHTYFDNRTALLSLGRALLDAATDQTVDQVWWVVVLKCFDSIDIDLTNLNTPTALRWPSIIPAMTTCVLDTAKQLAQHPERAAELAGEVLGDTANGQQLTDLTQRYFKLGKLAGTLSLIVKLSSYIGLEVAAITDALVAGIGASNASDVTLNFLALPASTMIRADGIGPVTIGMDQATAIERGHLTDRNEDSCTVGIDGTTDDVDYAMPAPRGNTVRVFFRGGEVSSLFVKGRWTSWTGVRSGMTSDAAINILTQAGFQMDITDAGDPFGAGRIDAYRGDTAIMYGPPDDGGVIIEAGLPAYSFCD